MFVLFLLKLPTVRKCWRKRSRAIPRDPLAGLDGRDIAPSKLKSHAINLWYSLSKREGVRSTLLQVNDVVNVAKIIKKT